MEGREWEDGEWDKQSKKDMTERELWEEGEMRGMEEEQKSALVKVEERGMEK